MAKPGKTLQRRRLHGPQRLVLETHLQSTIYVFGLEAWSMLPSCSPVFQDEEASARSATSIGPPQRDAGEEFTWKFVSSQLSALAGATDKGLVVSVLKVSKGEC